MKELAIITVSGEDRVGLIAEVTALLAKSDLNIIDIEQKVIQGRFFMFMVVEMGRATIPLKELEGEFDKKAKELELEIHLFPFSPSLKKDTNTKSSPLRLCSFWQVLSLPRLLSCSSPICLKYP